MGFFVGNQNRLNPTDTYGPAEMNIKHEVAAEIGIFKFL